MFQVLLASNHMQEVTIRTPIPDKWLRIDFTSMQRRPAVDWLMHSVPPMLKSVLIITSVYLIQLSELTCLREWLWRSEGYVIFCMNMQQNMGLISRTSVTRLVFHFRDQQVWYNEISAAVSQQRNVWKRRHSIQVPVRTRFRWTPVRNWWADLKDIPRICARHCSVYTWKRSKFFISCWVIQKCVSSIWVLLLLLGK